MPDVPPEAFGPAAFQAATSVSRETLARLKLYVSLLEDWNARLNLVSAGSLAAVWKRHIWDSAQLQEYMPKPTQSLVDLGSGAGFPGVVLATLLGPSVRVVLYESIAKKCRFLEEVARRVVPHVEVRNARIEQAGPEPFEVVTARACAPLTQLLAYAEPFQGKATRNLFLKGQSVASELTEAHKSWKMQVRQHPSCTDPSGTILEIGELRRGATRP